MKTKPVIPRERAELDITNAITHCLKNEGEEAALEFVNALEKVYTYINYYPKTGSPFCGHELNLPGLRSWPLKCSPYSVFYIEHNDHIDVWRVLQEQRDLPVWMQEFHTL